MRLSCWRGDERNCKQRIHRIVYKKENHLKINSRNGSGDDCDQYVDEKGKQFWISYRLENDYNVRLIFTQVLPLFAEIKDDKKFTSCFGVLNCGMVAVMMLNVPLGMTGYLKWGENVEDSLTLNLPYDLM